MKPEKNNAKKILVVDDDDDMVEILKHRLAAEAEQLFFASDGREALKLAIENCPDLIILDHFLPGLSGEEVCKAIKEHEDEKVSSIPILMLSGKASLADKIVGHVIYADAYLAKPFETNEFLKQVRHLLVS